MANPRRITKKSRVFFRPASAAGSGSWTEISGFAIEVTMMAKRTPIDTGGVSDYGTRQDKGDPDDSIKLGFFHSRDWSAFSELLMTELAADDPTELMFKTRGSVATSADEPYIRCKFMFLDSGNVGGPKNTPSKLDVTYKIEGVFQKSTTAGDPPADNTFADYV